MLRKEDWDPSWPPNVAAPSTKNCLRCTTDKSHALPNKLGLQLPVVSPTLMSWVVPCVLLRSHFPLQHKSILPFWTDPILFPSYLHPFQVGGVPRSGIYTRFKAREKDQRDPREKRFPSSVLFIMLLLLPLKAPPYSTVAPLCIPGYSYFLLYL